MKKIYLLVLLCVPLCLILVFGTLKATGGSAQEEQTLPGYGVEKEKIDVMEIGKLLERLGKEIQESKSITVGGMTYPTKGIGYLALNVMSRRPGQTGIHMEINASGSDETPRGRGNSYVAYSGGGPRGVTRADFAATLAGITENIASTGSFMTVDHKVALKGNIAIRQRMWENVKRKGNNPEYNYVFDIYFGDVVTRAMTPTDEQNDETEYEEAVKMGWIKEHAIKTNMGVDKDMLAKLFEELSAGMKDGKAVVGSKSLDIGENIRPRIMHTVFTEEGVNLQRIRVGFMFGDVPRGRRQETGPRYSKELFDEPMKNVAEMLKRIGMEMLEMGKFKVGENEFTIQEKADYEIHVGQRGFSIELQYVQPPKKDK
jgi:hypothetical protein